MKKLNRYITDPDQLLSMIYEPDFKEFEKTREFAEREGKIFEDLEKIERNVTIPEWVKAITYKNYVYNHLYEQYTHMLQYPNFIEYDYDRKGNPISFQINFDLLSTHLAKKYAILTFRDTLFAFVNGKYHEAENLILSEIEMLCNVVDIHKLLTKKKIASIKTETLSRLKDRTRVFEYPFKRHDGFLFLKNGVLYLEQRILLPSGPFWFNFYRINASYNPDAKSEKVENFIKSLVPQEKVRYLMLIPACCLLGRVDKIFMLVGEGANGKSTYLNFLTTFLGHENCSSVALQEIVYERFKSAELEGKIANIYADLPEKPLRDPGKLKLITGHDSVQIERKFRDSYKIKNTAVMIFSTNRLPEVNDETYAFWRRFYIIEFPYRFSDNPEISKWACNPSEEDKSAFLNLVLLEIDRITLVGIPQEDSEKLKEMWKRNNDSVYAFVLDKLERDIKNWIPKDVVYSKYVEYCEENDLRTHPKNIFAQKLAQYIEIRQERRKIGQERIVGWVGIRFKEENVKEGNENLEEYFAELH